MTDLASAYKIRLQEFLEPVAKRLEEELMRILDGVTVDRISTRAKSFDRFIAKATKMSQGHPKYEDPLSQIQDQVGARIITFYLGNVNEVAAVLKEYYRPVETRTIVPDTESEFGYFGMHFIFLLPKELTVDLPEGVSFFELQIKTLFQHAWSEANHDLAYKPNKPLTKDQLRKVAFTSAQAWGADMIFEELQIELNGD
jgi:putative GTP pyrophosphokinase